MKAEITILTRLFNIKTIARNCIVAVLALSGCTTTEKPISHSLLDITGESRVTRLQSRSFPWFTMFEQHEAFSVNGLLHMPEVGQEFHFPGRGDPASAIGIAVAQSYKLIGESEVPTTNEVENVRTNLDEVQFLTVRLGTLDEDIKGLRKELQNLSTNQQTNLSITTLVTNSTGELSALTTEQTTTRTNLLQAQARLRKAASRPGIMIARWQATNSASGSAVLGSIGSASIGASKVQSGFVVLGGVRVVSIVYGEDLWRMLNNLRPHEQRYVLDFGITTYLIQANSVAYSSQMDLSRFFNLTANVSRTNFQLPTSAEVRAAVEQLAEFGNSGNFGHITWRKEPYCFVCGIDLPELTTNNCDKVVQRFFSADQHRPREPEPSYQGWRTVVAKVAHFGRALTTKRYLLFGNRIWEYYKDKRPMEGAPTCPVCSGRTNAFIPGYGQPKSTNLCDPVLTGSITPSTVKPPNSK